MWELCESPHTWKQYLFGRCAVDSTSLVPSVVPVRSATSVAAGLGNLTKSASGPRPELFDAATGEVLTESSRVKRFRLQTVAGGLAVRNTRVKWCQKHLAPTLHTTHAPHPDAVPGVQVRASRGAAHYTGLMRCGSVWACPVCAAIISERRRRELRAAVSAHEAASGAVVLVTYTVRHHAGENLRYVLGDMRDARRALWSGRWAQNLRSRFGIVGQVRALEVTHGRAGWHPHYHELLFCGRSVNVEQLEAAIAERWAQLCAQTACGRDVVQSVGCRVSSHEAIDDYVTKWGLEPKAGAEHEPWGVAEEVSKQVCKEGRRGGRSPLALLVDAAEGDAEAARLWSEYEATMFGLAQLYWSRGLRERLGLGEEVSDEEAVLELEEEGELVCTLSPEEWRLVCRHEARGRILELAALEDGAACVAAYLAYLWGLEART